MNIKSRIEKLESDMNPQDKAIIVYVQNYSGEKLPDSDKEIARQRAEGKRLIVVRVPYGYVPEGGYTNES